jgi:hypothetical protein
LEKSISYEAHYAVFSNILSLRPSLVLKLIWTYGIEL